MPHLAVSLLGPMQVTRDGVTVTGFGANAAPARIVRQAKPNTLVAVSGVDVMFAGAHRASMKMQRAERPKAAA